LVLKNNMTVKTLQTTQAHQYIYPWKSKPINLQNVQEKIYQFLVEIVQTLTPDDVLREFKSLFIDCLYSDNSDILPEIYRFFITSKEQEFKHTITRCCYIIINNWERSRKYKHIEKLVNLFEELPPWNKTNNRKINIYKKWLDNFVNSDEYTELKLFAYKSKTKDNTKSNWTNRYTAYLLVAQSLDTNQSQEEQEAAIKLSKKLKDKFKLELAMYIARCQSAASTSSRYKNPSILGDNVLRIIKMIILKKGVFSYENVAHIFIKQTQGQTLEEFKQSIQKYLFFSVETKEIVKNIQHYLAEKLSDWKNDCHDEIMDNKLLLRTCNRVIDCLITENGKEPSPLFILLLSQGHSLTLVIVLLKIILICRNARSHLEIRIAHLINYYEQYPEDECKWFINFVEIFNITFAIYAENVEYNLLKINHLEKDSYFTLNLDDYRVFSQLKVDAHK
jgi:hypothetical protein